MGKYQNDQYCNRKCQQQGGKNKKNNTKNKEKRCKKMCKTTISAFRLTSVIFKRGVNSMEASE